MTENAIFAGPNYVDATFYSVAFSQGSWQTALPLTNLADPLLQAVARSTDATNASTKFVVDLGVPRPIFVIAIPKSTLSQAAQYKITGASDSGFSNIVYAGAWTDVWGTAYPFGSIPFEHPAWWTGKIPAEDAADYPWPLIVVLDPAITARYWKFEFDDTTNAAGYVDLARLVMAEGWQPTVNIAYGAEIGWETSTVAQESLGGVIFYDVRPRRRNLRCIIDVLTTDEALANFFELERSLGIDGQIMFIKDYTDTSNLARTSFLMTFSRLNAVQDTFYNHAKVQIEGKEVI